jgi:hypothetical protein
MRTAPGDATALVRRLPEAVNGDAALVRRGRRVTLSFLLGVGDTDYLVTIATGRVTAVEPRSLVTVTGRFSIRAARPVWEEFWQPVPRRDHHDLWAMLAAGKATLEGDLLPLMQNLQYFKDVLAAPRRRAED